MKGIQTIARYISLRWRNRMILNNISFVLEPTDQVLLVGAAGAGKTLLSKAFTRELFHEGTLEFLSSGNHIRPSIQRVEQHYHFSNRANMGQFYYQQRYNSTEADDAATIKEELLATGKAVSEWQPLLERFSMVDRINAPLLQLSSGEHKRFQLIRSFLQEPDIMILDEPFTGMDTRSRELLSNLINEKAALGMQFILIADPSQAPSCINRTIDLDKARAGTKPATTIDLPDALPQLEKKFHRIVHMENTGIHYGSNTILSNVNWTIVPGDCWWLKGVNGAGKSTLLSLITGDNPKAYANRMELFDRKRGTGESIWDIKKNIGYVSPELQWYFERNSTVFQAVASGLFDTIGLFRQLNAQQDLIVRQWLQAFHLQNEQDQPIWMLSTSQQRLALLARAMVKNPPLLVLDEPCQGLSDSQQKAFTQAVNRLCEDPERALIYVTHYETELPDCINHKLELSDSLATIVPFSTNNALTA